MTRGIESLYIPGKFPSRHIKSGIMCDRCDTPPGPDPSGPCNCGCGINRINPPTRIIPTRRNQ